MKIVFKHLPLAMHKNAKSAAVATEAAYAQGKFWEMHDLIFQNQRQLSPEKYYELAGTLGLDVDKFKKDFASAEINKTVETDSKEAASLGVTGTPAFFINGRFLSGAKPFEAFKEVIDQELGSG